MNIIIIIVTALFTIVLIVYAYILFRLGNRYSKLKDSFLKTQNHKVKSKFIKIGTNQNDGLGNKLNKLERDLGQRISELEQEVKEIKLLLLPQPTKEDSKQEKQHFTTKYLKEKNGEFLSHETNNAEEGKFKLVNIQENKAHFEFSGQVSDFVSPDYFDKACEFTNNPKNLNPIKNIKTVEKGDVEFQSDGSWKVIKKAKIKFE
jgi:hypothetical protein